MLQKKKMQKINNLKNVTKDKNTKDKYPNKFYKRKKYKRQKLQYKTKEN